ncbi:MAG: polynucleotide adenylyltransferase PcnB [Planctomycetota bacterium]
MEPRIVPRSEHNVSRQDIDPDALRILYRLNKNGHCGYLVGGGVRDLMLGRQPKDFDIATDARPRRVKRLFRNCRIIGRRFRLAHLHYPGEKIIEVATFRSTSASDGIVRDGELIQRDNVYGTAEEDALRRDLTINGLFYNIDDFSVIDYVGGVDDLRAGLVRTIGDPVASFREDPVRMTRTLRHAARLGFDLEPATRRALHTEREEIHKANAARLIEEIYKDLSSGCAARFFADLHDHDFLKILVPDLVKTFRRRGGRSGKALFLECLDRIDENRAAGREVTHAQGLAALFAPLILPIARDVEETSHDGSVAEIFQEELEPIFRDMRVYRRDQERLWHVLGAWHRLQRAIDRGKIPQSLKQRHYLPEAAEIVRILEEPSDAVDDFVDEVRSLPPVPAPKDEGRRRRRPRGPRKKGASKGAGAARAAKQTKDAATPQRKKGPASKNTGSKKRRRPRRKPGGKPSGAKPSGTARTGSGHSRSAGPAGPRKSSHGKSG